MLEGHSSSLKHVDQSTRGSHQKMTSHLQISHLLADTGAAVDDAGTNVGPVGELPGLIKDLKG